MANGKILTDRRKRFFDVLRKATILAVVMIYASISLQTIVLAEDAIEDTIIERNIILGTSHITGAQKSNIYYGRYPQNSLGTTKPENGIEGIDYIKNDDAVYNNYGPYYSIDPVKWRVLSVSDDSAILFVDKILESKRFNETYGYIYWDNCTIRSWLNGYDASSNQCGIDYTNNSFINSVFSLGEIGFMKKSSVDGVEDIFYLLSYDDAKNVNYGFVENADRIVNFTNYHRGKYQWGGSWWLRSWSTVGYPCDRFYVSAGSGVFPSPNLSSVKSSNGICPAFKVSLETVLFTSGTASDGYALTFLDKNRSFAVKDVSEINAYQGDKISFEYTDAFVGNNEYISAMIVNSEGECVSYQQLAQPLSENGTSLFDIPFDLQAGEYTVKIFNEQYNGEKKTSYSSDFVNIPLTVKNKPEFEILSCSTANNKTIATISIPQGGTYHIIFADYESEKINDTDVVKITVTEDKIGEITQASEKEIILESGDKIMLWQDVTTLTPLCEAYIVK